MTQLRQTIRRLFRSPGFTLTTVLTLSVGIGATIAIFSVVNGILLKPLPFPNSDRLIALVHQAPGIGDTELAASPAFYLTYREHSTTFESVALWVENTASVTGAGDPEEVPRLMGTHELLSTLGVQPLLGRTFNEADDQRGGAPTVILSYGYWQRRFGGAENVLGQTLIVDGRPHEIVGVLPPEFRFTQRPADIVSPGVQNGGVPFVPSTGERGIARLKDGVTLEQASADVARMIPIYLDSHPIVPGLTREAVDAMQLGPNLRSLKDDIVGDLGDVLWVLMGTIGLLLLIACANVANLQLVRTEIRGHELAIRAALGAARGRIARSLLLESVLLAVMGGIVGLAIAAMSLPLLLAVAGENLPAALEVAIDPTVLVVHAGDLARRGPVVRVDPRHPVCARSRGDDVERRHGAVAHAEPGTSSSAQCARRRASGARVGAPGRLRLDDPHVPVVARRRPGFHGARPGPDAADFDFRRPWCPSSRVRFGCRTTSSTGWPRFPAWNPSASRIACRSASRGPTGRSRSRTNPTLRRSRPCSGTRRPTTSRRWARRSWPAATSNGPITTERNSWPSSRRTSRSANGARRRLQSANAYAERRPRRGSRSSASPATCGSTVWSSPRRTPST